MKPIRLRRMVIHALVWATAFTAGAQADPAREVPARILFIGNSYTGVNDLPGLFQKIVASTGAPEPEVKASTPGGRTLQKHLSEPGTLRLIDEGRWDVVVLQGQSQEASLAEQSGDLSASFLAGAKGLQERIKSKNADARIVYYQTWARHADYWTNPEADTRVGQNPSDMQARNRGWYRRAAKQGAGCTVAPVGDAWELNYKHRDALRLHSADNSHPAYSGSYLAGLVLYATIYQAPDSKVPFRGELTETEAAILQRIATQAVRSSDR